MIKNHIIYTNFLDYQFTLKKAQGSFLWTKEGKKLIDFTSGWNVANLGWNDPEIIQAVIKQAKKNTFTSMWIGEEAQINFAKVFIRYLPDGLNVFCRVTGGTEANEKALILARSLTGRKKVIGFRDTYHGQSFGTMSIGYRPEYVQEIAPLVPEFIQMKFPSTYLTQKSEEETLNDFLELLEQNLTSRDVAAVVTEAGIITGWGSTHIAPRGYLSEVRRITKKYGTLLILDEVGTGFGRCGKMFGWELENVTPDIMTFAKGLTNGVAAMGAVAISDQFPEQEVAKAKTHSTFGWMPIACAAAIKVLEIHNRDQVWKTAQDHGAWMLKSLQQELNGNAFISQIVGIGMEFGVTFVKDSKSRKPDYVLAQRIIKRSFDQGLHLIFGGEGNIQIMPALTTPKKVLEKGIEIFLDAVHKVGKHA